MNKILHIILISLFSLTVISCAKKDDTTTTTTSSPLFVAVEIMEQFLPRLMEPHGLQGLLDQRKNSGEVPTETVPWWWWVFLEQFSPHRME